MNSLSTISEGSLNHVIDLPRVQALFAFDHNPPNDEEPEDGTTKTLEEYHASIARSMYQLFKSGDALRGFLMLAGLFLEQDLGAFGWWS